MHYLIITSEFPPGPGGIGMHAYCMAKGLVHNGTKITVLCSMDYTTEAEISSFLTSLPENLTVHRIKRNSFLTYINRITTILSLYKEHKFDKVILTGRFPLWIGIMLKKIFGEKIRTEAIIHGSEIKIGNNLSQYLTRQAIMIADKCHAVSAYTKALIQDKKISRDINVLPNGLDISSWSDVDVVVPFEWKGYPKLLTVGSITQRKGQHNIIRSLQRIIEKYPEVHYYIAGKDDNKSELTDLINRLKLQNNVSILGKLSEKDLKRAYKSADVFCMLSEATKDGDVEGFGIAVLEANIYGLAAIGSSNTGLEDAIQDDKTGYLVNAHDAIAVLSSIDKLLGKDKKILSENCRSWAMKHDWNILSRALM